MGARLGNISRASVCAIENEDGDFTLSRISRLADALETTEAYLLGYTEDPDRNCIDDKDSQSGSLFDNKQKQMLFVYVQDGAMPVNYAAGRLNMPVSSFIAEMKKEGYKVKEHDK